MTDEADGGAAPQEPHGTGQPKIAWSDSVKSDDSAKKAAPPKMLDILNAMNQQIEFDRTPQRNEPGVERTKLDTDACRDVFTRATAEQEVKFQEQMDSRVMVRAPLVPPEIIENFTAASPCDSSWDKMTGTGRFRICTECKANVYDFSSMEPPDIEKLVFQREGGQSNFFFKRKDGRYMVNDCPVAVKRRTTIALAAAVVGLLVLGAIGIACLTPQAPPAVPPGGSDTEGTTPAPPS